MKIEHIGILVTKPISMGNWYKEHLGLEIVRQLGTDDDGVTFIKDPWGLTIQLINRIKKL